MQDAERHRAEDEKKRENAELRNKAETLVHTAKKTVKDLEGQLSADEGRDFHAKIDKLEKAVADYDYAAMQTAHDELETALHALAEKVYQQQGAQPGAEAAGAPGAGPAAGGDDDDVIDAEFEEAK